MNTLNKLDLITNLLKSTYYSSKKSHDILFSDCNDTHESRYNKLDKSYREDRKEIIAALHLNKAIAEYNSLKSYYYSNIIDLEDTRIDDILHSFNRYSNEFLTSLANKHSYQHTDIYFEEFKDSVTELLGELI